MPLSLSTYLLWGAGTALELLLCALALRNGLFRRLRFFTLYVLLVAIYEVSWFGAIHALGNKPLRKARAHRSSSSAMACAMACSDGCGSSPCMCCWSEQAI